MMKKCVVLVGEDEYVCGREGTNVYTSEIVLETGKTVVRNICVCDRHKQVFEEMWNDQGSYQ